MDGVVFDPLGGDGFECTQAHMQRDVGETDALRRDPGEQLRREMQAGGRRGGGDLVAAVGVDRLVAFAVEELLFAWGQEAACRRWFVGTACKQAPALREGSRSMYGGSGISPMRFATARMSPSVTSNATRTGPSSVFSSTVPVKTPARPNVAPTGSFLPAGAGTTTRRKPAS